MTEVPLSDASDAVRSSAASRSTSALPANTLGLFDTTASTLANIGPGISAFLVIPAILAAMGAMAPWSFLISAVAILCTGNSLIEFARRMPSAGSFISYLTRAVDTSASGSTAGTAMGSFTFYLLLLLFPVSVSSLAVFFGSWLAGYAGLPTGTWIWFALGSIAIVMPFLLRGTGVSVRLAFGLFLTEAVVLLVLSTVVLANAHTKLTVPFHQVDGLGFKGLSGLTFGLAVFAFVGWENSATLGEETKNPRRTVVRTVVISVLVCMVIFFVSTYAIVVGFAGWKGTDAGIKLLAGGTLPAPYLNLSAHYAHWLHFVTFVIGLTSSLGAFVAAGLPGTRYIFHGARAGLLPRGVTAVSQRTGVPWVAMTIYLVSNAVLMVILDLIMHNPVSIASGEAGISTVPLLLIYGATCVLMPVFVWRVDRSSFSPIRHILVPILGLAVVAYGIWESIKPGQPAPANHYWIFIVAFIVLAAAASAAARLWGRVSHDALAHSLQDD